MAESDDDADDGVDEDEEDEEDESDGDLETSRKLFFKKPTEKRKRNLVRKPSGVHGHLMIL